MAALFLNAILPFSSCLCVRLHLCVHAQCLRFYGRSWGCSTGVVLACRNVCVACDVRTCNAGQL